MRKFLVLCVVLILTLISPIYAFADDSEESNSSGDRLATEEELQELDAAISETSHNLALLMASGDSVKATDYEQATYNLLSSIFGSSSTSWASIVATRLGYLSTINTSANGIAVKLTQFYNSINPDYDTTGISMYDLGHGILTALTSIDPNDGDLTIIETLVYITTALDDLDTDLTAILNSTYSIDNKLVTINTTIVQFKSDLLNSISTLNTNMNTGFTNVNANLALMLSRLQSIQSDFNTISWTSFSPTISYYFTLEDAISSSNPIVSNSNFSRSVFYIRISDLFISNNNDIYKILLPFYNTRYNFGSFYRLKLYTSVGTNNSATYCYLSSSSNDLSILYLSEVKDNSLIIELSYLDITFTLRPWSAYSAYYINSNNIDFYTIHNYISSLNFYNSINKFVDLYASDDLIAAKEDQQAYEDQAIQDFTGSGSAAASGQDLGDMKSISGAIKSGLQTGGSVNNALAPFNTNSGFWGWFSQSNYDNINNIPSSGTRSGNNSQPDIIDFYTNNQYTLQGLLSGGGN